MATIGGLTNSTSNSIRGYGGLASGMDRDTLIEGMTIGTTNKITQQQQKKQQLEWKQSAIREITEMMISFANKYTDSWTSSTHLFSSTFWGRTQISTTGANSKYVSVTGNASTADAITVMGVKQMAENAKWSTDTKGVSDKTLTTGKVDFNDVHNMVGKTLEFEVTGADGEAEKYTVTLENKPGYDYTTIEGVKDALKEQLKVAKSADGTVKDLSNAIDVSSFNDSTTGTEGIELRGGADKSERVVMTGGSAIGLLGFNSPPEGGWDFSNGTMLVRGEMDESKLVTSFEDRVGGKGLTFSYNGTSKTVYMPSAEDLKKEADNPAKLEAIQESLQKQLDSAFGKNRVTVAVDGDKLTFKTTDPSKKKADGTYEEDPTSTLTLTGGDSDVINGALGTRVGESNRVNLNVKLSESGLAGFAGFTDDKFTEKEAILDENGNPVLDEDSNATYRDKLTIQINGKDIAVYKDDTMSSLMSRINSSDAGVKVSYQSVSDKLTFTATENGASGSIEFGFADKDAAGNITGDNADKRALVEALFGADASTITGANAKHGQDAIVAVKYSGSDEVVELIRDTNTFTVDGLAVAIKGEFGYKVDDAGNKVRDEDAEAVNIDARVDSDKIVDGIKAMIEEYNKMIEVVNKQLSTRPDRDYQPLTSEQRKEMSEEEIKLWEEKAKTGMLYNDSDLRTLSSDLRFIISGGNSQLMSEIGITTSNLYSDNGKLSLDETKLRAALETDPQKVERLFTAGEGVNDKGSSIAGMATNLKNTMKKYVNTLGSWESKGILVKKAGAESSPISLTENYMYKQLQEINKSITKLQTRLETERDRYIKQFTSLETLISQMNSQSSWLSQVGGY